MPHSKSGMCFRRFRMLPLYELELRLARGDAEMAEEVRARATVLGMDPTYDSTLPPRGVRVIAATSLSTCEPRPPVRLR